jgi:glycosyltransferase involved in cell wall biosynthesis
MRAAVLCNTSIKGGGELSAMWLAVQLHAPLVSLSTNEWRSCKAKRQVWYMNNSIYKVLEDKDDFRTVLGYADEIYIILNFVLGGFERQRWIEEYPVKKVFFLNEEKRKEYIEKRVLEQKHIPTVVLPPPVDIDKFLSVERHDRNLITIGRHSRISLKYPDDPVSMYEKLAERLPEARFAFMIPHPKIVKRFGEDERFKFYTFDEISVLEFLRTIDIYLSIINPKTREQGPRTLIEAMATGLPCVVENRDGMKDRMVNGLTGFLVNNEDAAVEAVARIAEDRDLRISFSHGAREIAKGFRPERWVEEIKGGK